MRGGSDRARCVSHRQPRRLGERQGVKARHVGLYAPGLTAFTLMLAPLQSRQRPSLRARLTCANPAGCIAPMEISSLAISTFRADQFDRARRGVIRWNHDVSPADRFSPSIQPQASDTRTQSSHFTEG